MASTKATVFIHGRLFWAKILGEPRPNYAGDAREWAFEVEPNEKGLQELLKRGFEDRIKGKGYKLGTKKQHADRAPFITLKKGEFTKDGNPNTPIRVYDEDNVEWDKDTLIGNETEADVKLDIRDYGDGKFPGIYPVAIRVTSLVRYESDEFGAMDGDEPAAPKKAKKDTFKEDFGLDDPVP